MGGLHLFLEGVHLIIVAYLPEEGAGVCEFADGDSLVGSFSSISGHEAL